VRPRPSLAVAGLLAVVVAVSWAASRLTAVSQHRIRSAGGAPSASSSDEPRVRKALATFASYRELFERHAVTTARVAEDGSIELEADLRAAARASLARIGAPALADALPARAVVRIVLSPEHVSESWRFRCAGGCVLDLFVDPPPDRPRASELPGRPEATVRLRFNPRRLAGLAVLGPSAAAAARRLELVEQILGRPIVSPLAEDLEGYASLALYRNASGPRGVCVLSMTRTDRVRSLVDLAIGLAALTRGSAVRTHRDVPIGAFVSSSGRTLAMTVDGPRLLIGDDVSRIEDAIDLRRDPGGLDAQPFETVGALAALSGGGTEAATLRQDGSEWILDARGARPIGDNEMLRGWVRGLTREAAQRGED